MPIVPEDKDWTWVLERPCPDCGFDAQATPYDAVPGLARDAATRFTAVLSRPNVAERPNDSTWSPLEYSAHVRDVCRIFAHRVDIALGRPGERPDIVAFEGKVGYADDLPVFENWNQDRTAEEGRYRDQNPAAVAGELQVAAENIARAFESVPRADRAKGARRSNGSQFTVESMSRYFIHDVVHHLHDVRA